MNKIITSIIGLVAVAALVLSIGNAVGGNTQSLELGTAARTRFPNGLSVPSTGTSTIRMVPTVTAAGSCFELSAFGAATTTAVTLNASGAALVFTAGSCN